MLEAIGIARTVIDRYFTGTASRIGGVGLDVIAREALARHSDAYPENRIGEPVLDEGGNYQWRRSGEHHHWNPETVAKLQHAVKANDVAWYREYAKLANASSRQLKTLRGLFDFKPVGPAVPIAE